MATWVRGCIDRWMGCYICICGLCGLIDKVMDEGWVNGWINGLMDG